MAIKSHQLIGVLFGTALAWACGSSDDATNNTGGNDGSTCGNGTVEATEDCEGTALPAGATCGMASGGVLPNGTLRCNAQTCQFDVSSCTSAVSTGGNPGTGGNIGAGGNVGAGGGIGNGGFVGAGGFIGAGGMFGTGGGIGNGGSPNTGGAPTTGGAPGNGGITSTGGAVSNYCTTIVCPTTGQPNFCANQGCGPCTNGYCTP